MNTIIEICTSAFPIWDSLLLHFESTELGQLFLAIYLCCFSSVILFSVMANREV